MAVSTKEVRSADYRKMRLQNSHCLPATQVLKAAQELGKFRGHLQVMRLAPVELAKLVNA